MTRKKKASRDFPLTVENSGYHSCYYCKKKVMRVREHLINNHADKKLVEKLVNLQESKKFEDYKQLSIKLIRRGDFRANEEALAAGHGEIFVVRLTKGENDGSKYRPCVFCSGFFLKRALVRHWPHCPFANDEDKDVEKFKLNAMKSDRVFLKMGKSGCHAESESSPSEEDDADEEILGNPRPKGFKNRVLSDMVSPMVPVILADETIYEFGKAIYQADGTKEETQEVRKKMILLARMLVGARKLFAEQGRSRKHVKKMTLLQVLDPSNARIVAAVIRDISGGLTKDSRNCRRGFLHPYAGLKAVTLLKEYLDQRAVTAGAAAERQRKKWNLIFKSCQWKKNVSKRIGCGMKQVKRSNIRKRQGASRTVELEDVIKFSRESYALIAQLNNELENANDIIIDRAKYNELASATLASLTIFNCRRAQEVTNVTFREFQERRMRGWEELERANSWVTLNDDEKELARELTLVEVDSKNGELVPVLLRVEEDRALRILARLNETVFRLPRDEYIFKTSASASQPMGTGKSIQKTVKAIEREKGADFFSRPNDITPGTVRKLFCTTVNFLDLSEQDVAEVLGIVGHSLRVHNRDYLQMQRARHIGRVGKLLQAFSTGALSTPEVVSRPGKTSITDIRIAPTQANRTRPSPSVVARPGISSSASKSREIRRRRSTPPEDERDQTFPENRAASSSSSFSGPESRQEDSSSSVLAPNSTSATSFQNCFEAWLRPQNRRDDETQESVSAQSDDDDDDDDDDEERLRTEKMPRSPVSAASIGNATSGRSGKRWKRIRFPSPSGSSSSSLPSPLPSPSPPPTEIVDLCSSHSSDDDRGNSAAKKKAQGRLRDKAPCSSSYSSSSWLLGKRKAATDSTTEPFSRFLTEDNYGRPIKRAAPRAVSVQPSAGETSQPGRRLTVIRDDGKRLVRTYCPKAKKHLFQHFWQHLQDRKCPGISDVRNYLASKNRHANWYGVTEERVWEILKNKIKNLKK